jgi:hypothetical protein
LITADEDAVTAAHAMWYDNWDYHRPGAITAAVEGKKLR